MACECAHRPYLLEDSATSLLLVFYTRRCSGQGCPETFLLRFRHSSATPSAPDTSAASVIPLPSLELGDHLVREEPHGRHHHVARHRGRPVDLEHNLVGAKVLLEHRNPVHHCFWGPKEVDFRRRRSEEHTSELQSPIDIS